MNIKAVLAVVAGLSVVAIPACMASNAELEATMAEVDQMDAKQQLSERWTYKSQTNEMRGITTKIASIRAEGWIPMSPELMVFRVEGDPFIAIRGSLDEAAAPMMHCQRGLLQIKFDDGPIRDVGCLMGMEVGIDPSVFPELQRSRTMWVETWTSIGTQQYKFKTAGLVI